MPMKKSIETSIPTLLLEAIETIAHEKDKENIERIDHPSNLEAILIALESVKSALEGNAATPNSAAIQGASRHILDQWPFSHPTSELALRALDLATESARKPRT